MNPTTTPPMPAYWHNRHNSTADDSGMIFSSVRVGGFPYVFTAMPSKFFVSTRSRSSRYSSAVIVVRTEQR